MLLRKIHHYLSPTFLVNRLQFHEGTIPSSIRKHGNSLFLAIQAKPQSKSNSVVEINDSYVKVSIKAVPENGEANQTLISYLA